VEITVNSRREFAQTSSTPRDVAVHRNAKTKSSVASRPLVPAWSRFAPLGVAEPLLPLVVRPVGEVHDARAERLRIHELQCFLIPPFLKEALPTA
jgi:hypothetical protein